MKFFGCFMNDAYSLKHQLLLSYTITCIASAGITLAICYGLVYGLGSTSSSNADSIIISQSKSISLDQAKVTATAIGQQLKLVAESVCLVSATYASTLLNHSQAYRNGTLLKNETSYKEYNFLQGCLAPACPSDFGSFQGRSRFPPNLPGYQSGSLAHSSMYLYTSKDQLAKRNDSAWNGVIHQHSAVQTVINGLAYQDQDMAIMYTRGSNATVMFYLSAQIPLDTVGTYASLHRTFPGIVKNVTNYDAPNRSWFKKAPRGAYYLYGPYVETFTRQEVITVSSKSTTCLPTDPRCLSPVTVVSAGVMLIANFIEIISSVSYPDGGYGALIKSAKPYRVLVWGDRGSVYNASSGTFKTVTDFEPALAGRNLNTQGTFEFTDDKGVGWIVSSEPFFFAPTQSNALVMLTFSVRSQATQPLISFNENIDTTTHEVTRSTAIIMGASLGGIVLVIFLLVLYLTAPLETMRELSHEIAAISADEEVHKDYIGVLSKAKTNLGRYDEVGLLAADYHDVVYMLHQAHLEKIETPKYPASFFHLHDRTIEAVTRNASHQPPSGALEELQQRQQVFESITWTTYLRLFQSQAALLHASVPSAPAVEESYSASSGSIEEIYLDKKEIKPMTGDLDVLSSFGSGPVSQAVVMPTRSTTPPSLPHSLKSNYKPAGDSETDDRRIDVESGYKMPESRKATRASARAKEAKEDGGNPSLCLPLCSRVTAVRTQLYLMTCILLAALLAVMVVTVVTVQNNAYGWMDTSSVEIENKQVATLLSMAAAKAVFVEYYYAELTLNLAVGAAALSSLLDGNLTAPNWNQEGRFLRSYSEDVYDREFAVSQSVNKAAFYYSSSGYFIPQQTDCSTASKGPTCKQINAANETRLTSLFDIKLKSFLYPGSTVSFMQLGFESGLTRYYPAQARDTLERPKSCQIEHVPYTSPADAFLPSVQACRRKFDLSVGCSNPTSNVVDFPSYDPRCRDWYQQAIFAGDPSTVGFQYPRVSSSGAFVITAYTPIKQHASPSGKLRGVLSENILASTLTDDINSFTILSSGYSFLIDAHNTTQIVAHPAANAQCTQVDCAENFGSPSEYLAFKTSVLDPLQRTATTGADAPPSGEITRTGKYIKRGRSWRYAYSTTNYRQQVGGSVVYCLFLTVPNSEVLQTSTDTSNSISSSTQIMIALFVVFSFLFVVFFYCFTTQMITSIVEPVNDLRRVLTRVKQHDLSVNPSLTDVSSADLKLLLDAFSRLLIALRFGSDTYAKTNPELAFRVYSEAFDLFTTTQNEKGIGASLNNLAACQLSRGNFSEAETLSQRAIENGTRFAEAAAAKGGDDADRARRMLSDRKGNLAAILLESGRLTDAFALLEQLLEEDKQQRYIRGCVVKQGTLGQYYLKQGEFKSAERILASALAFVQKRDGQFLEKGSAAGWDFEEACAAEQIALYNLTCLMTGRRDSPASLEAMLIRTLASCPHMHAATTVKTLVALRSLLEKEGRADDVTSLELLAEEAGSPLKTAAGEAALCNASKRVVFCLDYSGSMSGAKIRSAVGNILNIFAEHVSESDSIAVITFNGQPTVEVGMTVKREGSEAISKTIASLIAPNGGTALYDAISAAIDLVKKDNARDGGGAGGANSWVIALTDGEDNQSRLKVDQLVALISEAEVGLIVVGVGQDVETSLLQRIAGAAGERGHYVFAEGDKKSIDAAFGQVIALIQSQLVLEEL